MKFQALLLAITVLVLLAGTSFINGIATANQGIPATEYEKANVKKGAQLYDNWLKIVDAKPEGNHPLYPEESKKSGTSTWRCKECHGWDYIGDKGRYSKGSHFTGIPGVFHLQSATAEALYTALTSKEAKHDFSVYLTRSQLLDLVKFLREGQADIIPVINEQGQAKGDTDHGKIHYAKQCASCHGSDGNTLDFKSKKEGVQGVGWLALDNPQESIHKIRWGHPGSNMPSMMTDAKLSEQDAIDILNYSQMLGNK